MSPASLVCYALLETKVQKLCWSTTEPQRNIACLSTQTQAFPTWQESGLQRTAGGVSNRGVCKASQNF